MAPRILIFSIAMGADYTFHVKSIATNASTFLRHNNSVLARVMCTVGHGLFSKSCINHIFIRGSYLQIGDVIFWRTFLFWEDSYDNFKKALRKDCTLLCIPIQLILQGSLWVLLKMCTQIYIQQKHNIISVVKHLR